MSPITELIGGAKVYGWGNLLSSGSFESIATVTSTSGTELSLVLNSIPSTYKHLQLRFSLTMASGGTSLPRLRINNDSTDTRYYEHGVYANGTNIYVGWLAPGNQEFNRLLTDESNGSSTTYPTIGILDILDYANTNKYKTFRSLVGIDMNGSGGIDLRSGTYASTNAITRLDFLTNSGYAFKVGSTFDLYGIKGAA